jgi:superfamily II DNA or RNA helicase
MNGYHDFIGGKHFRPIDSGFDYKSQYAFQRDYQKATVEWALARGRAAAFLDTGLGKTNVELEFAQSAADETGKPSLILAPLCVSRQIQREAEKFGFEAWISRDMGKVMPGVNICNYEQAHKLDPDAFGSLVLDESSILKGMDGKMRRFLTDAFRNVPYRLSASATPAPNDFMELGTQAEFLGIMTQVEMLATFFIHDGGDTSKWRLKGHGRAKFFEWLATWSVIMKDPSDYGFTAMEPLPPLHIEQVTIESGIMDGLLPAIAQSMGDRQKARRETVEARCRKAAEFANSTDEQVLVWCGLNAEGDLLQSLIPDSVQVAGSDSDDDKESRLMGFTEGKHRVLITKPKIAGWGMNWQHANQMIFVGLSDSWEQFYQAVRREWRRGQQRPVYVKVITADIEGAVVANIKRKQDQADQMMAEMAKIASQTFDGFEKATSELRKYNAAVKAPLPQF